MAGSRLKTNRFGTRSVLVRLRTLERGFSITRDEHGRLLRHSRTVQAGERIRTQLTDGEITSRVESP